MTTTWRLQNRDYLLKQKRKWHNRQVAIIKDPRVGHWTPAEDAIALREEITIREKSVMLHRNYSTVANRIRDLTLSDVGICKNCQNEFPKPNHLTKRHRGMFCSRDCHYELQRNLGLAAKTRECNVCEKSFVADKKASKYCSLKCMGVAKRKRPLDCHCLTCNTEFVPQISRKSPTGYTRFCSRKCYGRAKTEAAIDWNTKRCKRCDEYFVSKSGREKFCSKECGNKGRVDALPILICEFCGGEFKRSRSYKSVARFCSIKCRSLSSGKNE